ncbi:hypothetical protein ACFL02_01460 [Planctomycetota bacterium]
MKHKSKNFVFFSILFCIFALIIFFGYTIYDSSKVKLAKRVLCSANLASLGRAIAIYQMDNKQMPPDLEILISKNLINPEYLVCPVTDDEIGDISYIYRGYDLPVDAPEDMLVAYDKKDNHIHKNVELYRNVLFANWSVRRIEEKEFAALIDRDNELRRELGLVEKPAK